MSRIIYKVRVRLNDSSKLLSPCFATELEAQNYVDLFWSDLKDKCEIEDYYESKHEIEGVSFLLD